MKATLGKILHLTTVHSPYDVRIYYKECVSLADAGYDVSLLCRVSKDLEKNKVKLIAAPVPKNRLLRPIATIPFLYRKCCQLDADIYHIHDPELILVGYLLAKKGKRIVYDVHEDLPKDIYYKDWIPSCLKPMVSKFANFIEKRISKSFSAVVAATKDIESNFHGAVRKVVTIRNYVEFERFAPKLIRQQFSEPVKLCYVGSLTEVRGIKEYICATHKLGLKLVLCGSFTTAKFQTECEQLPGWKDVEYLGSKSYLEVAGVLRSCDIGLVVVHDIPPFRLGLPTKLFEYMSAGLIAIGSNIPGIEEVITKNNCGICVEPNNADQLCLAIQSLLINQEQAFRLRKNGYDAAHDLYNWAAESKKLQTLYREIMEPM